MQIHKHMRGEAAEPRPKVLFELGENVRVIDGPFTNFTGVIKEVNPERGKLKVMVSIFGRSTPVELEFYRLSWCEAVRSWARGVKHGKASGGEGEIAGVSRSGTPSHRWGRLSASMASTLWSFVRPLMRKRKHRPA